MDELENERGLLEWKIKGATKLMQFLKSEEKIGTKLTQFIFLKN